MPTLRKLPKELIKFLSVLLHNIFAAILIGIIGLPILISLVTGTLNTLIQAMKLPIPLWATISLVYLCCLYTYLKVSQYLKKNTPSDNPTIKLIEIGNFKWKTSIHENGDFEIHPIPYCKEHEIKLVSHSIGYFCPAIQLGCKSQIMKKDIKVQYDTATSIIEGMINKSLKC